jgi:small subunit ribosomal protein S1
MVLEVDRSKRRIRLGLKQLEPSSIDEYIAEHKVGDSVTGRIVDASKAKVKVELGDGVMAACQLPVETKAEAQPREAAPKVDLSEMTAMLSAKWKQGAGPSSAPGKREAARAGQVRSFRIAQLDAASKTIELELAE